MAILSLTQLTINTLTQLKQEAWISQTTDRQCRNRWDRVHYKNNSA